MSITMKASADGWRGRLSDGFSARSAALLATCVLDVVDKATTQRILISYDSRRGGREAASAIASAIKRWSASADVQVAPHLPTPVVSGMLASRQADLAFLVTASHNPADWNGVKVKVPPGGPLSEMLETAADSRYRALDVPTGSDPQMPTAASVLTPRERTAITDLHAERLIKLVPPCPLHSLHVVVDGLNGIAGRPMSRFCAQLGYRVTAVGQEPKADFGGLRPDPTLVKSRERCAALVVRLGADLGLVLDGDGDRVIFLDHQGVAIDSADLMAALLLNSRPELSMLSDGTVMVTTTCGQTIRAAAKYRGSALVETAVGFKHLAGAMRSAPRSVAVGSVGDYGFESLTSDRDPLAAVLLATHMLAHNAKPLATIIASIKAELGTDHLRSNEQHLQRMSPGEVDGLLRTLIVGLGWPPKIDKTIDGDRVYGPDGQWVLVRPSSTEGGYRVYSEINQEPGQSQHILTADKS